MHYLSIMNDDQTLVMYSGHPMGLFPSSRDAPRVVITNGMVGKLFFYFLDAIQPLCNIVLFKITKLDVYLCVILLSNIL